MKRHPSVRHKKMNVHSYRETSCLEGQGFAAIPAGRVSAASAATASAGVSIERSLALLATAAGARIDSSEIYQMARPSMDPSPRRVEPDTGTVIEGTISIVLRTALSALPLSEMPTRTMSTRRTGRTAGDITRPPRELRLSGWTH